MTTEMPGPIRLGDRTAAWLVAYASGAVLMLEILSLRLVAPYVGVTLETSTAVIGFALAAIAAGAKLGGQIADHVSPTKLLGPTMVAGGILVLCVGPAVRWTGGFARPGDAITVLLVTAAAVFVPASLLSAISPMVVKLQLTELSQTGTVVGALSGVATLGALVSTFATGFLLVATVPTSVILLVLGASLVVIGVALSIRHRTLRGLPVLLAVVVAGGLGLAGPGARCDVETAYHCALIVPDEDRGSGRLLQLDTLSHSYVDLADPTHLEFSYIRGIASVVDAALPQDGLRALHLGGGGLTLPRYLVASRSNSDNLVFEIDGGVVQLDEERLGARLGGELEVRVEDARVGLAGEPSDSRDLVVGDAFSGLSVPWHLTTIEAVSEVRRVLGPDGLYVVNVIDYPPLGFIRAEAATIAEVFPHLALIGRPEVVAGNDGGNLLIVGSEQPLPIDVVESALTERAPELEVVVDEDSVESFVGDASALTDDFAPVDQLLTPYPPSA